MRQSGVSLNAPFVVSAFCDVRRHSRHARWFTLGIMENTAPSLKPVDGSVLPNDAEYCVKLSISIDGGLDGFFGPGQIFRMDEP